MFSAILTAWTDSATSCVLIRWAPLKVAIAAAAMEAAVGLALILVAFRLNSTIDVRKLNKLKG